MGYRKEGEGGLRVCMSWSKSCCGVGQGGCLGPVGEEGNSPRKYIRLNKASLSFNPEPAI